MANFKRLLTVLLLFFSPLTFAGYAQLKPPPGWSSGMGAAIPGTPGTFNFGAAANGAIFKGSTVLTNASLNVAGQLVTVPVSMRLAANAGIFAANYSFGNPAAFAALAVGSVAYNYFNDKGLKVESGVWVKRDPNICTVAPCYEYANQAWDGTRNSWYSSPSSACAASASNSGFTLQSVTGLNCNFVNMGSVSLTQRTVAASPAPEPLPITESQFHAQLDTAPIPQGLPPQLPGVEWPYESPVINPNPSSIPTTYPSPSSPPVARPINIPTGNPVPTSDPNVFNQPILRVTPSPTTIDPWRVDVQPQSIPQPTATPKTSDQLNPTTAVPSSPTPVPGLCDLYPSILACAPASTLQDKLDFCKSNPDVAACQKLDKVQSDDLQTKNISSLITPDSGWGSDNASCPAARKLSIAGAEFSFQMMCDFSSGIRPIILALAWLSAAFILLGMRGSE